MGDIFTKERSEHLFDKHKWMSVGFWGLSVGIKKEEPLFRDLANNSLHTLTRPFTFLLRSKNAHYAMA
jgi:hypothetical protein